MEAVTIEESYPRQSMEAVLGRAGEIRESFPEGDTLELNFEAGRSWPGVKERAVTRPPWLLDIRT